MQKGLISVVMPCFNAASHIEQSVGSALSQLDVDLEVVVVDDGSTDDSYQILSRLAKQDPRLRVFSQANRGAGPARNRGLAEARGEYIAFLDSDDYWDPTCLRQLKEALVSDGADLAYCGWQNVGLSGGKGQPYVPPDYAEADLVEAMLGWCLWPIHAALTRRSCIDRVGGFDEQWSSCMDYDLWLRMSPFVRVVLVPKVLAFYRHYDGPRITSSRSRIALNHWRIQQEFIKTHPDVVRQIGRRKIRDMTHGLLLYRAFEAYWSRDLLAAHRLFRVVIGRCYGKPSDWKYLIFAFLPASVFVRLVGVADSIKRRYR